MSGSKGDVSGGGKLRDGRGDSKALVSIGIAFGGREEANPRNRENI